MTNESMISLNVNLGSTKNVTAEFNALIKVLESKKIKLDIDTTSLQASLKLTSSEIEKSYSKIKDTVKKANDEISKPAKGNNSGISELEKQISSAEKAISKFTETKNKQLNNILAGNNGTMVPNLTEYDTLVKKMNELKNIQLDSTNVSTYTKNVKEVQTAYDELTTKIKQVNSTTKEMNSSAKMDSDIVNKIRDYNTQLEVMRQKNADIVSNPLYQQIANDVNKLSQASQPLKQLSNETNTIDNNMKKLSTSMTQVGNMGNVFTRLGQSIKSAFSFMSASMVFYQLANQIRDIPEIVRSIDTSLTELQKTSDLTGSSLKSFTNEAYNVGETLARTGKEVIDASSEFSKSGYGTDELLNLSEAALLLTNVGDGITDVSEASGTLISAMKGFGIESSNVISIVDKINAVSNSTASNFEDISFGLERMSGTLGMAGTSIDETISMFTAVNEVLRNSEIVSSGLNSVFMRMRGLSEDTGEAVDGLASKLKGVYDAVDIDMTDENGQLRETFDVLNDLSEVWSGLSVNRQQYIAQESAGTRQSKVFISLMNQWDTVQKSINTSLDSTGSAMQENERYLNSINGRISQLKSAWEQLATTTLSSDTIKTLVSGLTQVVEFIDEIGGLIPVLTTILGLMVLIKSESIAAFAGTMIGSMKKLASVVGLVSTGYMNLGGAMAALNINPMVAGFTALVAVLGAVKFATDKAKQAHEDYIASLEEKANKTQDELDAVEDLESKYKELYETTNRTEEQNKELLSVQSQLITSLGLEKGAIDASKQSWDDLSTSINNAKREKIEYALQTQNDLVKEAQDSLKEEFNNNDIKGRFMFDQDAFVTNDARNQAKKIIEQVNEELGKEVAKTSEAGAGIQLFNIENEEQYYEVLRKIQEITQSGSFDDYWNSKNYESISNEITKLDTAFTDLDEKTKKKYELQIALDMPDLLNDLDIEDTTNMTKIQSEALKKSFADLFSEEEKLKNSDYIQYFNDRVDAIIDNKEAIDGLSNAQKEAGNSSEDMATSFTTNLAKVSENLGDIQSLYSTFQSSLKNNNGKFVPFDISDIEAIRETFGSLGDVFTDFEATLTSQSSTSEDVQKAFDDLTGTYLVTSNVLDGLNTSNRDMVVSQLELQGVQNASKIVTEELAIASEKLAQEGRVLSDVTSQEALQFINSANASDQAKQMLALYAIEKANANGITLMTNGDIDNLVSLIGYLGGATTALQVYAKAKTVVGKMEKMAERSGVDFDSEKYLANAAANAQKEIDDAINNAKAKATEGVNLNTPAMSQNGAKSSGGSKSSSEKYAEYIDSIYSSILTSLQDGTDKTDRQIAISQSKLENLELFGTQEDITKANSDLEKLYQDRIDIMKNSSGQIVSLRDKMAKELQATGYEELKGLDLTNISQLGVDKIISKLEKQIDSANNADNAKLSASLTYKKNLIEDYTGNIINANSEINSMAKDIIDAQNELGNTVIENINRVLDNTISKANSTLGQIDLEKMLLDTDGTSDAAKADAQKLVELNKRTLTEIVTQRKATEDAINSLRAQGVDEESDAIQDLLEQWRGYEVSRLNTIKEMAEARRKASIDSAQDEMDGIQEAVNDGKSLLDLTVNMLKKETEAKKDALKEQTDDRKEALKEQYDADKKALDDRLDLLKKEANAKKDALSEEQDERSYNDEVSEKQKQISNVQSKITELSLDDSVSAQKKRKTLEEELAQYKKELEDLQYNRSIELQTNAIDKELEAQEDKINAELEALEDQYNEEVDLIEEKYDKQIKEYDDYLDKEAKLRQEANDLIEGKSKSFYERLKAYATEYGSQTQAEFTDLWDSAYEGMEKYGNGQMDVISNIESMTERIIALREEIEELNNTSYKDFTEDDPSTSDDDYEISNGSSSNSSSGDKYNGLESKDERAEYRDKQLEKLISYGDQMKGLTDINAIQKLKDKQAEVAQTIGAYLQNGTYYIMINNKKYPVRSAVGVRHDGLLSGRLGDDLKPNEMMLKATKDEWVFTGQQYRNLEANLNGLLNGNKSQSSGDGMIVNFDFTGATVSNDTYPKFEKLLKTEVPKVLNDILFKKGIK